ncbi:MAG: Ig-like domain-containing protein [Gemmatimonadales bacterium]
MLGCGGGGDGGIGPGDDGGNGPDGELRIVAVTPAEGATDAEPAGQVLARFDRPIDAATLTPSTFTLTRDGTALASAVSYDPGNLAARLVAPLLPERPTKRS